MDDATSSKLKRLAKDIKNGNLIDPIPLVAQRAIKILHVLSDGQLYHHTEVAKKLNLGSKYVIDILRAVKKDWGLVQERIPGSKNNKKGWRLPLSKTKE